MGGRATSRGHDPARPPERKDAIATEAARLFAQHGFSAVGMDDIGAAVGITGPAIYRHFAGKDAVLESVIASLLDLFVAGADQVDDEEGRATDPDAPDQLTRLVATSVTVALDHPCEVATYVRERARLTQPAARRAAGAERHLRAIWARVLRQASPSMSDEMVMLRQQSVLGAMASMTTLRGGMTRPRLDDLLVAASVRMLRTPVPTRSGPAGSSPKAEWQPQVSRREAILNAALTLMRVKGYHGVGIDEIGDAAGITGPAVYRHYASKADILLDAYDRVGSRVAVGVEEALASATGPAEALERLIDSYVRIAVDNVNLIIATGQEGAALPSTEGPRLARQRRDIARELEPGGGRAPPRPDRDRGPAPRGQRLPHGQPHGPAAARRAGPGGHRARLGHGLLGGGSKLTLVDMAPAGALVSVRRSARPVGRHGRPAASTQRRDPHGRARVRHRCWDDQVREARFEGLGLPRHGARGGAEGPGRRRHRVLRDRAGLLGLLLRRLDRRAARPLRAGLDRHPGRQRQQQLLHRQLGPLPRPQVHSGWPVRLRAGAGLREDGEGQPRHEVRGPHQPHGQALHRHGQPAGASPRRRRRRRSSATPARSTWSATA